MRVLRWGERPRPREHRRLRKSQLQGRGCRDWPRNHRRTYRPARCSRRKRSRPPKKPHRTRHRTVALPGSHVRRQSTELRPHRSSSRPRRHPISILAATHSPRNAYPYPSHRGVRQAAFARRYPARPASASRSTAWPCEVWQAGLVTRRERQARCAVRPGYAKSGRQGSLAMQAQRAARPGRAKSGRRAPPAVTQ
jgi:hypothetical protein